MFKFETLKVWQKSQVFCSSILDEVRALPLDYRYTIGNNLIRAAISIPNNIAEGSGRRSKKESTNFYNIAKGSVYEVVNVTIVLYDKKLLTKEQFDIIYQQSEEIAKMLTGLINY